MKTIMTLVVLLLMTASAYASTKADNMRHMMSSMVASPAFHRQIVQELQSRGFSKYLSEVTADCMVEKTLDVLQEVPDEFMEGMNKRRGEMIGEIAGERCLKESNI